MFFINRRILILYFTDEAMKSNYNKLIFRSPILLAMQDVTLNISCFNGAFVF